MKEKNKNSKESIEIIDKQINKKCLSISEPNDHFEAEKFTYKITKCLTRQLKKKIKKIDQRLEVLWSEFYAYSKLIINYYNGIKKHYGFSYPKIM